MNAYLRRLAAEQDVPEALYSVSLLTLEHLRTTNPVRLYELGMAARNPGHVLFGNAGEKLSELSLIDGVSDDGTARMRPYLRVFYAAVIEVTEDDVRLVIPDGGGAP